MEERMTRITRYGRKVKTTFISTMFAACIAIVIGIPFVSKNMFNNDVGYYSISIRGTHVGAANTEEEARKKKEAEEEKRRKEEEASTKVSGMHLKLLPNTKP